MKFSARALIALSFLFAPNFAHAAPPVITAIIDAGSGGTRLVLEKVTPGAYPVIQHLFQMRIEETLNAEYEADDGIDNYACYTGTDPGARAFYATANVNPNVMNPLWAGLKEELARQSPPVPPADVSVKVFATAGMRSALETCGAKAVRKLYATIQEGMTAAGLTNPANEVRTIDGAREEGLWTFINANDEYANVFGRPGHPKLTQKAVGTLEVGGSSVQVAYPVPLTSADPQAIAIKINNKKLNVHAESYLHLGQNDMRMALRDHRNGSNQLMAYNCWANGFDKANDAGDAGHQSLSANGAFSAADPACGNFMHNYLKTYMVTPPDLSQVNVKFVGLGGIKYTLDAFGLLVGPYAGTNNFSTAVSTRCSQDAATWPGINSDRDVQYFCPHGAYIAALMRDTKFGIFRQRPAEFDRALMPSDVNNAALSWIQGYLLLTYAH